MELTQDFIKETTEKLNKKRAQLILEIKRLKKQDPFYEESLDVVGRNLDAYEDEVMELTGHTEGEEKVKELTAMLEQVKKALQRISEGTYGLDENTNEPIDIARLKAYPEATTKN